MTANRIPYFDFYPVDFMRGVRGLTAAEVGIYTMLLCRIYEENGPVEYHPIRLSAYCGVRESTLTKAVDRLIVLGRITVEDEILSDDRAMKEISIRETKLKNSSRAGKASAEKRQQKQQQNATPVQQAFNHTDRDTDKKEEEPNGSLSAEPTLPDLAHVDDVAEAVAEYNRAAAEAGWPVLRILSKPRRSALTARMREAGGIEGWRAALTKARASPHLCGQNDRGWVASFDFLTKQSSFAKLMEGNYDDRRSSRPDHRPHSRADAQSLAIAVAGKTRRASGPDWL